LLTRELGYCGESGESRAEDKGIAQAIFVVAVDLAVAVVNLDFMFGSDTGGCSGLK
jgi:hypothetical protein